MSLLQQPLDGLLSVRWVREDRICVGTTELGESFLLSPDQLLPGWAPRSTDDLDDAAIAAVLALDPELVLLGTGQRQRFPAASILAGFMRRGVGIEVMDNAAAARTYNLLAQEGRRVIAGFLLPG